ncbi:nonstructural protein [Microviridae sp.]|nr:nonstructural protein [Microviridae sp.]
MYNTPFPYQNDALAMRAARDLANDPNSQCCRSPGDFTLFHIGTYDDNTAEIKPFEKFKVLARFNELKMEYQDNSQPPLHAVREES